MLSTLIATFLSAWATGAADGAFVEACNAPPGEQPTVPGVVVGDAAAVEGDLPYLRVALEDSGDFMKVFYDPGSEALARARAACLGIQLALVAREVGSDRQGTEWDSVVFTRDPDHRPRRGEGVATRWVIRLEADGSLSELYRRQVVSTVPHEQVHTYQTRAGARLPRWVSEGHATWVQGRITPYLDPEVAATVREEREQYLRQSTQPLALAAWGSMRPRREAFLRQVSDEDRARMLADPDYVPSGAFTFTSDDFIGDESNMPARYAGALAVFEGLEVRHGADAVRLWIDDLTREPGVVTPAAVEDSVMERFGEALDDLLAEPPAGVDALTS